MIKNAPKKSDWNNLYPFAGIFKGTPNFSNFILKVIMWEGIYRRWVGIYEIEMKTSEKDSSFSRRLEKGK